MAGTIYTGSRSHGTDLEKILVGGFGWPEQSGRTERCSQESCDLSATSPTDLYCGSHDRFLPFARKFTTGSRRAAVVAGAIVVYGCFALAAQLSSWLPVFLVYALIGFAAVGLPLRLFPRTVRVTVIIWLVACVATLAYHFTRSYAHAIMVTVLVVAAACGLGLNSGINSVQDALHGELVTNKHQRPKGALAFVTGTLVISATAGVASVSLLLIPRSLLLGEDGLILVSVIIAVATIALGLLTAIVAGFIDGAPRINTHTPGLRDWNGPAPRTWRAKPIPLIRIHTMMDGVQNALIGLANAVRLLMVASARTTANLLLTTFRLLVNSLIRCANLIFKAIILLLRTIAAAIASAAWLVTNATWLAILETFYILVEGGLPVAALFTAAGLASVSAEETRNYLISGPLDALLYLSIFAILAIIALTIAWITLASQRRSVSLRSARRSARNTIPYALLFVAAGGWILGLPGTFGHGRIHVGWVTLASTVAIAAAFVLSRFISKARDESEAAGINALRK